MFQIEHIIKLCNFFIAFHRLEKRHEGEVQKKRPRKKLDRWWFFVGNSAESSGGEKFLFGAALQ
jgi:hypothetical protein